MSNPQLVACQLHAALDYLEILVAAHTLNLHFTWASTCCYAALILLAMPATNLKYKILLLATCNNEYFVQQLCCAQLIIHT